MAKHLLGSGSYGVVHLDDGGSTKTFREPQYKPFFVETQGVLDTVGRNYFGGKILEYIDDPNNRESITGVRMVYQGALLFIT